MRREEQRLQRGLGEGGAHAPGYQRALSRGWPFSSSPKGEPGASRTPSNNPRASPNESQVLPRSTDNNLALSTRKKGSGHPKGSRPKPPNAFSTGDQARSPSFRQATRAGAPANGSTRTRASTNGYAGVAHTPKVLPLGARRASEITQKLIRLRRRSPVCSVRGHAGPTVENTRDEPHATTRPVLKELSMGGVGVRLSLELNDTRKWRMKSGHLRRQDTRA